MPGRRSLPPRGSMDILDRLTKLVPELHTAEQQVARRILTDPTWVSECAIKALAQVTGASEPTVIRLCRKLGFDGFAAFKRKLTEDLTIARLYLGAEEIARNTSPASVTEHMLGYATQALREAAASIDGAALERAAVLLGNARVVYCFGVGGSSAILAEEAENRLFRLSVCAQSSADPYRQRMTAAIVGPGDVILYVSSTGKPNSLVESAALARSNGAATIAITARNSPLAEFATELLSVDVFEDEMFFNLPTRRRYAQLFMLDCLVATLAAKLPHAAENLKSIRATLGALHGVGKGQPIGD